MEQLKVLLVDDEQELVLAMIERLQLRGISAEGVLNGNDALKKVEEIDFDVVILDIKMPGIDGMEVLRRIKKLRPDTPILLLTGLGTKEESEMGIKEGACDYLMKPINIEMLIGKMRDAVSTAREAG